MPRPDASRLLREPAVQQLVLVSFLGFTSFSLTLASLPTWAVRGGVSAGVAGGVTTVMLLTTVVTQLLLPVALRRWGTGPVLVAGLLALGAPAPLLALSSDLTLLLPVAAVRGAGFAVLTVVGSLLTTVVAPEERHGETVGLYGLAIAVPNLVGVPLGVALTQWGSFWAVALVSAAPVLALPAAVALGRAHRLQAPAVRRDPGGQRVARAVVAPAAMLFAATLAAGGLVTYLPIALPTATVTASSALLLMGVTSAVSRWRVGTLADRRGLTVLLPGAVLACVAGMAAVAGALHAGSGHPGGLHAGGPAPAGTVVLLVGAALFGVGYGGVLSGTLVAAFARAGTSRAAAASSVWNASFDAGTAVGAVLLGALATSGLSDTQAFAVPTALMALTLVLAPRRR